MGDKQKSGRASQDDVGTVDATRPSAWSGGRRSKAKADVKAKLEVEAGAKVKARAGPKAKAKSAARGGLAGTTPKATTPKGPTRKATKPKTVSKMPVSKAPVSKAPAAKAPVVDPAVVEEIFHRFHRVDPEPKGELDYVNAYTLLVAVVLSAQATDVGVNKATRALFAIADTPQKMLDLGEDKVRDHIKTIGLFRAKAKNVIGLSRDLIATFGGEVPMSRAALETLPGVGRKSANVVMNIAFGEPTIAVDTHLFRVANRIPLAPGKTPLEVELGLEAIIPERYRRHAHHWLILHGRYVCKARKPECWRCLIRDLCRFEPKTPAVA
ncbi:DNA-(apurinic or apyrimidinic site) lyase /endonuclease III [Chelatococcus asaccharovorans]|uniref:Endonuclease III n=2 Tax=Chelatococcus asaccharovorans TaxID=28210 RepID=A0A2V3TU36_9HYPH|nr:DNA-(apurinic or apyrimidinic site) lyase /endonuclease III [Chelatococcus asaccharovorans]